MNIEDKSLLGSQDPGTLVLGGTLALEPLVKGNRITVVTTKVVQILNLVETDDPVLASERLFQRVELWSFFGKFGATDTVHGLTSWEERLEIVVRHLVPVDGVSTGLSSLRRISYIKLFFMAGVASSSTRYSPRAVK